MKVKIFSLITKNILMVCILFNLMVLIGLEVGFGINQRSVYRNITSTLFYILGPITFFLIISCKFLKFKKSAYGLFLFYSMYCILFTVLYHKLSILHILRLFGILFPFCFCIFLHQINESNTLIKTVNFTFFLCCIFSLVQICLSKSTHIGRNNGVFQGYNSLAIFVITYYFVTEEKIKKILSIIMLIFCKSASITILFFLMLVSEKKINKKIIVIILLILIVFFYYSFMFKEIESDPLHKILILLKHNDIYDYNYWRYLSTIENSNQIDGIDNSLISGLNRVVQICRIIFSSNSFKEFLIGNDKPFIAEGTFGTVYLHFGLIGLIPLIILYFKYYYFGRQSLYIFLFSLFVLPLISFQFSGVFVTINMFLLKEKYEKNINRFQTSK